MAEESEVNSTQPAKSKIRTGSGSDRVVGAGASPPSQPANNSAELVEPKKLVRFRANEKSPTIEIAEGEYRRLFKAEDQPFEVESDAELQMLRATGHFVEDKEAEKAATDEPDKGGSEKAKAP